MKIILEKAKEAVEGSEVDEELVLEDSSRTLDFNEEVPKYDIQKVTVSHIKETNTVSNSILDLKKEHTCIWCNMTFSRETSLRGHMFMCKAYIWKSITLGVDIAVEEEHHPLGFEVTRLL